MNLVEVLKPFEDTLNKYKEGRAGSSKDQQNIEKLIPIWNDYVKHNPKAGATISTACATCIKDMLKGFYNNLQIEKRKVTVPFKGVPDVKVTEPEEIAGEVPTVGFEALDWSSLKEAARKFNVPKSVRKKVDIIKWLNENA